MIPATCLLRLNVDREVVRPGETLTGTVVVTVLKREAFERVAQRHPLRLKVYGKEKALFKDYPGQSMRRFMTHCKYAYFKHKEDLWLLQGQHPVEAQSLPAGPTDVDGSPSQSASAASSFACAFAIPLPTNIPPSFSCDTFCSASSVRYRVELEPWEGCTEGREGAIYDTPEQGSRVPHKSDFDPHSRLFYVAATVPRSQYLSSLTEPRELLRVPCPSRARTVVSHMRAMLPQKNKKLKAGSVHCEVAIMPYVLVLNNEHRPRQLKSASERARTAAARSAVPLRASQSVTSPPATKKRPGDADKCAASDGDDPVAALGVEQDSPTADAPPNGQWTTGDTVERCDGSEGGSQVSPLDYRRGRPSQSSSTPLSFSTSQTDPPNTAWARGTKTPDSSLTALPRPSEEHAGIAMTMSPSAKRPLRTAREYGHVLAARVTLQNISRELPIEGVRVRLLQKAVTHMFGVKYTEFSTLAYEDYFFDMFDLSASSPPLHSVGSAACTPVREKSREAFGDSRTENVPVTLASGRAEPGSGGGSAMESVAVMTVISESPAVSPGAAKRSSKAAALSRSSSSVVTQTHGSFGLCAGHGVVFDLELELPTLMRVSEEFSNALPMPTTETKMITTETALDVLLLYTKPPKSSPSRAHVVHAGAEADPQGSQRWAVERSASRGCLFFANAPVYIVSEVDEKSLAPPLPQSFTHTATAEVE